jgi:hypothetical protein
MGKTKLVVLGAGLVAMFAAVGYLMLERESELFLDEGIT